MNTKEYYNVYDRRIRVTVWISIDWLRNGSGSRQL